MGLLSGIPISWILAGVLALAVGGYVWHCEAIKAEKSKMEAVAEEQQRHNAITALRQHKLKERSDEEYERRIAALRSRLQQPIASVLPPAAGTPGGSEYACFDRAELDAALGRFIRRAAGIVAQGDEAAIGLDAAKRWAQGL